MTDKTIDLDHHRGMAAQKATELRRLLADVAANQKALRIRQDELETHLLAAPAANWHEAAEKAGSDNHVAGHAPTKSDCRGARRLQETVRRDRATVLTFTPKKSEHNNGKGPIEKQSREEKAQGRQEQEEKGAPADLAVHTGVYDRQSTQW